MTNANLPRIAVVGGGVSGLAAAHRLQELRPSWKVDLFDRNTNLGGVLQTEFDRGYLIERAADNFLRGPTAPWAESLCERIGFADQLIETEPRYRGAKVLWNDRLYAVPHGFQLMAPSRTWPILISGLLTPAGKLRLMCEPFIRALPGAEHSLTEFACHRLGKEAFERLVQPLVAGIYTADADELSVEAALPQMIQMVRKHGSLYRGMRAQKKRRDRSVEASHGARYGLFVAPRDGMSSFVAAIQSRLNNTTTHFRCGVALLQRHESDRWLVDVGIATEAQLFDGVIVALSAHQAAAILPPEDRELVELLSAIPHASSAVICLGYPRAQIGRPLDAFGCVIPAVQNRQSLAISCSSAKFPGRAPESCELFRVFVGGALRPELAELDDDQLIQLARRELGDILRVHGEPQVCHIARWPQAMPQYTVGHCRRLDRIRELITASNGLQLAGNAYDGVGIAQCVRGGESAAENMVRALEHRTVAS